MHYCLKWYRYDSLQVIFIFLTIFSFCFSNYSPVCCLWRMEVMLVLSVPCSTPSIDSQKIEMVKLNSILDSIRSNDDCGVMLIFSHVMLDIKYFSASIGLLFLCCDSMCYYKWMARNKLDHCESYMWELIHTSGMEIT